MLITTFSSMDSWKRVNLRLKNDGEDIQGKNSKNLIIYFRKWLLFQLKLA
jgi:hypothetical protein